MPDRLKIDDLGDAHDGISHLTAKVGFQDSDQRAAAASPSPAPSGLEGDAREEDAVYFLSQITLRPTDGAGDAAAGASASSSPSPATPPAPADYFHLPADRTVTLGSTIDL